MGAKPAERPDDRSGGGHFEALLLFPDGGAYIGSVNDGVADGFGLAMSPEGRLYEGEWLQGLRHGHGQSLSCSSSPSRSLPSLCATSRTGVCSPIKGGRPQEKGLLSGSISRRQAEDLRSEVWEADRLISGKPMSETTHLVQNGTGLAQNCLQHRPPIEEWSEEAVQEWLSSTCLQRFALEFKNAGINGEQLVRLGHADLEEKLKIPCYGHQCQILEAIQSAQRKENDDASDDDAQTLIIPEQHLRLSVSGVKSGSPLQMSCQAWYFGKEVSVRQLRGQRIMDQQRLKSSLRVLAKLRHPGLALLLGVVCPQTAQSGIFSVASECADGLLLASWMRRSAPVSLASLLRITKGVALAMIYLHSRGVCHMRLSPQSVFLCAHPDVKVSDYAIAQLEACLSDKIEDRLALCSPWAPPEMLRRPDCEPDGAIDVYAFGIIMWEMLAGRPAFANLSPAQLVVAVGFGRKGLTWPSSPSWPSLWDLSRACSHREASRRPRFEQVLKPLERFDAGDREMEDALEAFFAT
eukprot:TRINITY_DN22176_c0_g1_i1.p1 TRINITY_DN22176_c0_g1~~TRINITY_DN22176_c0_g1_i1.p1  ORF type:complete len:522 (+),score=77.24 TRINITY_DN22176_c0_g1_i1:16-1581(+)